ncbi:MAG TPA: RNA polymerase sigma factor [Candidatus Acidoferrales bacterium]|nr:RNA polymerase sigma factor [Candidatus Acidoferrales bacterium]
MAGKAEVRDEDLLRRLAAGDEESFREFYQRHQAGIFRFALHMTGRSEAAEEIVQDAFMTLIRETGKFDAKRGAPQAFLYGIARNHVRRLLERERRYEPLLDEESLNGNGNGSEMAQRGSANEHLLDGMERAEIVEQVRGALERLPLHYREAVTLCDLQEHDYASAAAILECPIGTVRSRLARGREMLAAKLRGVPGARKSATGRR